MKRKIKLKDNISNKVISSEIKIRDKDHLVAQIKYPAAKFKDKRFKRPKYKNKLDED